MKQDLTSFERDVELRPLVIEDFDAIVALQLACFPSMEPWKKAHIESQLAHFPQGQLGVFMEGELVASSCSLIVDSRDYDDWSNWNRICDKGFITNHDAEGDTLYGIEMQVHPGFRGQKLSRRLYDARKEICSTLNLARMMIGGRIPGFSAVRHEMTAREYVDQVQKKQRHDPVLTAQISNGFVLKQLVPDYLPNDEDSAGYATCLEWPNLDHVPKRSTRGRRATQPVRVAFVQYQMRTVASFEEFERQVEFFVDTASDYRCDFLLFPELFTLQLIGLVGDIRPGEAARQLAALTPRYLKLFRDLAVRYNLNIIGGSTFTQQEDRLYNIAYLFRRDGTIGEQPKIHVTPSEGRWWGVTGGSRIEVFDTDCGKVAISICYDSEFPELARVASARGAKILFVPYNTNDRAGHLRVRYCSQARCIENHMFVVTAGCVGNLPLTENADVHYASSAIYTPSDTGFARDGIAAQAEAGLETIVVHDVDLEDLRRHRRFGTVRNWNDRRTDLYSVHWNGADGESIV